MVLDRLLRGIERYRVEVMTDRSLRAEVEAGGELVLPARYRYFLKLGGQNRIAFVRETLELLNVPLALLAGMRAAVLARRGGAAWIVSPLDGGFSQIAGSIAARLSGVPQVVLVFDLWEENAYGPVARRLGRALERRILRRARTVVVSSPEAAAHYRDKHGVACEVLPIPANPPDGAARDAPVPGEVLVAGAVYWAQEDAVRRLVRAASNVPGTRSVVMGDEGNLRGRGIVADRYESSLPGADFRRRLTRADVLFLGLSFDSPYPEVIRMATPARLHDYMASGRPLLVHAPAGSHVAEYARSEDFAEVVDEPDTRVLEEALRRVLEDPERAADRSRRAQRLALERHDATAVRKRFEALLQRLSRST